MRIPKLMYRTDDGGNGCFVSKDEEFEKVVSLAKAVINDKKIDLFVEPFACGSSLLSNRLFPDYEGKLIFHLTDLNMNSHIQGAISAKVDYESLIPWLLDKRAFIYCDPPHDNFDTEHFCTLINLLQNQNYVLIRSIKPLPLKKISENFYIQEHGLLDKWIQEEESYE